ncbi:MAG: hypothetical protein ACI4JB_09210 [Porcipelethomonas sp.]
MDNDAFIESWETFEYKVKEGSDDIELYYEKMKMGFKTAENASIETLMKQEQDAKTAWEKIKKQYEVGGYGVREEEVKLAEQLYNDAAYEVERAYTVGSDGINNVAQGMRDQTGNVTAAGQEVGQSGLAGVSSCDYYSEGVFKGQEFASGLIATAQNAISEFINSQHYNSGETNISDYVAAAKSKIGKTATGGIVTHAQTRIVGEDGAEAIVPLEKNTKWIDLVAYKILSASRDFSEASPAYGGSSPYSEGAGSTTINNFTQNNTSPKSLTPLEIYRKTKNLLNMSKRR